MITLIRNIQTRSWKNIKQEPYWANGVFVIIQISDYMSPGV